MADVLPFRAIRPPAGAAAAERTSPSLEALSAFAGAGAILPRGVRDAGGRSPPARSAAKETLRIDPRPAFFAYRQEFRTESGIEKHRLGLLGLLDPAGDPVGQVHPIQDTESYGVERCVEELSARGLQEKLVIAGFEDSKFEMEKILERGILLRKLPDAYLDLSPERHRLWKIEDEGLVAELRGFLRGRDCFVIDGTHVYRAMKKIADRPGPSDAAPRVPLTLFLNILDFGISLSTASVLVGEIPEFKINELALRMNAFFEITAYPFPSPPTLPKALTELREDLRLRGFTETAIGALFRGIDQFFLFTLREGARREEVFLPDVKPQLREFDAVLLRRVIIERYLARGEEGESISPRIDYSWSVEEAVAAVRSGKFQAAFFTNPPNKRKLVTLAREGLRLPPGSARLDPPPRAGLVMHAVR